jgi:D-cysteine desulfhydrase family pyridoxal phosphate-dependent enzyme
MIPRIKIADLPTPVEMMPRLSELLGGPRLMVKRDDLTGLGMGGNKTRKLEFTLAEAQANGARTLITVGAAQSNHCRQTAALAAKVGMDCILVLSGEPPQFPNANLLLDHLFGAEMVWSTRAERDQVLKQTFDDAWAAGRRPYLMPLGASNPTGSLAYAFAFDEFLRQGFEADWIVVASSSGGTQAGLALGARRAGWKGGVLGISIDEPRQHLQKVVSDLATQASERFEKTIHFSPEDILVNADYLGGGYGVLGKPEIETIQMFARTEGLLLDPVYTGRAAAGLVDLIRKGIFKTGDRVLFWHTGGTPALFADGYYQQLLS